jgi:hypothetical protein
MRRAIAMTAVLMIVFLMGSTAQFVKVAEANFTYLKPTYVRISIQSPQNTTYNTEPIFLNFTVETNERDFDAHPYFYLLDGEDGQSGVKIEEIQVIGQREVSHELSYYAGFYWDPYIEYTLHGHAVLSNLSDGEHNVTVFADFVGNQTIEMGFFASVPFTTHNTPQSEPQEPFPITLVVGSITSIIIAVVGIGLFVYFKKYHKRSN